MADDKTLPPVNEIKDGATPEAVAKALLRRIRPYKKGKKAAKSGTKRD